MKAHTPGPWRWTGINGDHYELISPSGSRVVDDGSANGEYDAKIDVHGPDARLMAAAPELLALLIESQSSIGGDWRERRDAVIAKTAGSAA